MSKFKAITVDEGQLKMWLQSQESVFPVGDSDSSLLVCHCLLRELSGVNDELTQFIQDDKGPIGRHDIQGEIGLTDGMPALRIFSRKGSRLSITIPALAELVEADGKDLFIKPSEIARWIVSRGCSPVAVRDWLMRAIFSEFDPKKMSYRDQLWVLKNNEVLLYAELVARGDIIFQDMHDITAHLAGLQKDGYSFAGQVAASVYKKLSSYFGPWGRGNMPSHLIPFLIGVILDGLTQSMIYASEPRRLAIEELLLALENTGIDPRAKLSLTGFPKGIDRINGLLQSRADFSMAKLKSEINLLVEECSRLSNGPVQRSLAI